MMFVVYLLLTLHVFQSATPFAVYMTQRDCNTSLTEGIVMMGTAIQRSTERLVVVRSGDTILSNGTVVSSLTSISFEIEPKIAQSVLEVRAEGFVFVDGACDGKRKLRQGELTTNAPLSRAQIVIIGAWATSMASGVRLTPPYVLVYEDKPDL